MPELPPTRRSLLIRLGERSEFAWAEFLQIYEQAIRSYCRRFGLQDADARDVTQEVMAAVDQRFSSEEQESWRHDPSAGSFRGWLLRVARNIALRRVEARRRGPIGSGDSAVLAKLHEVPVRGGNPDALGCLDGDGDEGAMQGEYQRALLRWAADIVRPQVTERSWQSFERTAIRGQQAEAVAEDLSTTVGCVYTAKCRVLQRIRREIAGLETAAVEGFAQPASVTDRSNRSAR